MYPPAKKSVKSSGGGAFACLGYFLSRLFFWVPATVHWAIAISPCLVLYAVFHFWGLIPAIALGVASVLYVFDDILYPRNIREPIIPYDQRCKWKNVPGTTKRVAVIGAGPCGITTCKELMAEGHKVTCFEASDRVGGTFYGSFWPEGQMVSSSYITCFSDFEPPRNADGTEHWEHHTAIEYVEYLEAYAAHFGVAENIQLMHKVIHVFKDNTKFWLRVQDTATGTDSVQGPFDNVAVCTGAFHCPLLPPIRGIDTFTGKIRHTRDFARSPGTTVDEGFQEVSGKRVLAIGLGESLADILYLITLRMTKPASYAAYSVRAGAFVIPRVNPLTGLNNDFDTNRVRYSLPKFIHNMMFMGCAMLNNNFGFHHPLGRRIRYQMMRAIKYMGPGYIKTTKSDNFVRAIEQGKCDVKGGIDRIEGSTVYFQDGSVMSDIDVLICGTGYGRPNFPFFDKSSFQKSSDDDMESESCALVETSAMLNGQASGYGATDGCGPSQVVTCATKRFLRMIDSNHGTDIAFIGLGVRPLIGAIPPIAELQARLYALLLSGKRELPSKEAMNKRILKDAKLDEYEFARHNENWTGLVNYIPFMDIIAREIGCVPKREWFITRPYLAYKVLLGPILPEHYRLYGPHADPDKALDIIRRVPFGARKRDLSFYIGTHFLVGMVYWPITLIRSIHALAGLCLAKK